MIMFKCPGTATATTDGRISKVCVCSGQMAKRKWTVHKRRDTGLALGLGYFITFSFEKPQKEEIIIIIIMAKQEEILLHSLQKSLPLSRATCEIWSTLQVHGGGSEMVSWRRRPPALPFNRVQLHGAAERKEACSV